ncbi:MAG TPA: DUF6335 family protein [Anaerolineaceae bacterium]|nr:DUF6335 family protein [Anaerolineaceae bacterium]
MDREKSDESQPDEEGEGVRGRGSDLGLIDGTEDMVESITDIEESSSISAEIDEDSALDLLVQADNEEEYKQSVGTYTTDANIVDDFADRQNFNTGREELVDKLEEYTGRSPEISADDIDAAWQDADQAGEETVGGTNPTPDQDIVEEIGEAAGLTYKDDEPLNFEKVGERDEKRWELNPSDVTEIDDQEDMESLSAIEEQEDEDEEEIVDAEAVLIEEDIEEEDEDEEDDDEEEDEEDYDDDLAEDVDEFDLVDLDDEYDLEDDEDEQ